MKSVYAFLSGLFLRARARAHTHTHTCMQAFTPLGAHARTLPFGPLTAALKHYFEPYNSLLFSVVNMFLDLRKLSLLLVTTFDTHLITFSYDSEIKLNDVKFVTVIEWKNQQDGLHQKDIVEAIETTEYVFNGHTGYYNEEGKVETCKQKQNLSGRITLNNGLVK